MTSEYQTPIQTLINLSWLSALDMFKLDTTRIYLQLVWLLRSFKYYCRMFDLSDNGAFRIELKFLL